MADATFKHGSPTMMDFVAESAVAAGDVIVTDDAAVVAHRPIAAGETGAVATGGGSYEMVGAGEIQIGDFVYFNSNKVNTSQSGAGFGFAETYCSGDGEAITVRHDPYYNWD